MTLKIVPKRGTIVPEMSTAPYKEDISQTLFGKTRRAVLSLLYSHVDEAFYLRQIVRVAGVGLGAVQRELKLLSDAGIIQRIVRGRQVYYQANPQCPVFGELKALVIKTVGIAAIVQAALAPLADRIRIAGIYGSIARSEEHRGSDVDLSVVGKVTFAEIVSALDQAQKTINREIATNVVARSTYMEYSFLQNTLHNEWCWKYASTLESRIRYINVDCIDTFPFAQNIASGMESALEQVGEKYYEHRRQLMLKIQLGLTKTYNQFHNKQLAVIYGDLPEKEIEKKYGKETLNLWNHLRRTESI